MAKSLPAIAMRRIAMSLLFAAAGCDSSTSPAPQESIATRDAEPPAVIGAQAVCANPPTALNVRDIAATLRTMTNAELNRHYEYQAFCEDDTRIAAAILDELIRRGDRRAINDQAVRMLYNGDASDDARGLQLLRRAAELGNDGARTELEAWERRGKSPAH